MLSKDDDIKPVQLMRTLYECLMIELARNVYILIMG